MPHLQLSYIRKVVGVLASLFVFGRQQDLTRPVTLDIPVESAAQALKTISQQTSVTMNAIGNVGTEIVFLKVQNRPLKEVMDKLAGVTKATWRTESNGSYTLIRPQSIVDKENEKHIVENVGLLDKWLKKQTANLEVPFDKARIRAIGDRRLRKEAYDDWNDNSPNDDIQDPIYRAFSRSLQNIDLRAVAKLLPAQQIVFSTAPTKVQYPLPASIIHDLIKDQENWGRIMKSISWTDQTGKIVRDTSTRLETVRLPFATFEAFLVEPYLASVIVRRDEYDYLKVFFTVFGKDGQRIVELQDVIEASAFEDEKNSPERSVKDLHLPKPESASLTLWGNLESKKSGKEKSDYIRFGLNAMSQDGLKVGNQELMSALAIQSGKAIVACVPDGALIPTETDFEFSHYFANQDGQWSFRESTTWIELFPQNYVGHWHTRVPRNRISNVVSKFASNGNLNLRNYALLHCGEFGYLAQEKISILARNCLSILGMQGQPEISRNAGFLHLFASLTDDQLNILARGKIIPYRQLSPFQREISKNIVYGAPGNFLIGGEASTVFGKEDSTFELPNGIDDGPGIGLEVADDDICMASHQNGSEYTHAVNFAKRNEEYAPLEGMCGTRRSGPHKGMLFEFRKQKRMTLRCYLSPTHWFADDFREGIRKTDGVVRSFRNLPKILQSAINNNAEFDDAVVHRDILLRTKANFEEYLKTDGLSEDVAKHLRETIKQIDEYLSSMELPR